MNQAAIRFHYSLAAQPRWSSSFGFCPSRDQRVALTLVLAYATHASRAA